MIDALRITPLDVLYLRGNRLFEQAGNAEALMPPWPSLFAGALRSRMLIDGESSTLDDFSRGALEGRLGEVIGAGPTRLGTFRVAFVALERCSASGARELLIPTPADLVVHDDGGTLRVARAIPRDLRELGVFASTPLSATGVVRASSQRKTMTGTWLTDAGLRAWQQGALPSAAHVVPSSELWRTDPRLGIALDAQTRSAADGMLYTSDCVALAKGVSFVVGVRGASGTMPTAGLLRIGGDGRGADVQPLTPAPAQSASWQQLPKTDRFTMMLATPMLSSGGWLPPGATQAPDGDVQWQVGSLRLRIRAASVGRGAVVSGWDLAQRRPKAAKRVAPAGSVYWLERLEGELAQLGDLLERGLGSLEDAASRDRSREAEGFGNVWFGDWPEDEAAG